MFTSPEQFAAATKTLFDLQMQTFNTLASKTVQGMEQVVALNISAAKNSVEGALAAGRNLTQARDSRAALQTLMACLQPGMGNTSEYYNEFQAIINEMHREFRQAADTHVAEVKNTLSTLIYDLTQNVNPGSENAVGIMRAAIDNVFQGYEQVTQATRQAMQTVEEQAAKASAMVMPGVDKPSSR